MISSPFNDSANELELNSKSRCAQYRILAVGNTHLTFGNLSARDRPSEDLLSNRYLAMSEPKSSRPWRKMKVCVCCFSSGAMNVVSVLGVSMSGSLMLVGDIFDR